MANTRPVYNLTARFVDSGGYLVSPWNMFFQQFVQRAPAIQDVSGLGSPYIANQNGTIIVSSSTGASLRRGQVSILLQLNNGQVIIPISIGDEVFFNPGSVVQFLGS